MKLKDILGILFCVAGVTLGTIACRLFTTGWFFIACLLLIIGVHLIWTAERDHKLRKEMDVPGDVGDNHTYSGGYADDGISESAYDEI